jgi:16S rRNA (uracil1498-N3)-methyltransferase
MPRSRGRFFAPALCLEGETLSLGPDEARHARARRLRGGEPVTLFDGRGGQARAVVVAVEPRNLRVRLEELFRESAPTPGAPIELLAPVLKMPRLSWMVEKATELGAARIVLVDCSRSQADRSARAAGARGRLQRVCREAAKQCGRSILPEIEGPLPWTEALARSAATRILLDPSGARFPSSLAGDSCALWVGPEGGFTSQEIEAARDAGWRPARLPGAVLRAETAAVAALALAGGAFDTFHAGEQNNRKFRREGRPRGV